MPELPMVTGEVKECSWSYSEGKWVCLLAQLCQKSLLQLAQRLLLLLHRRKDLDCGDKQVFPEEETQDVEVFPTITECAIQSREH